MSTIFRFPRVFSLLLHPPPPPLVLADPYSITCCTVSRMPQRRRREVVSSEKGEVATRKQGRRRKKTLGRRKRKRKQRLRLFLKPWRPLLLPCPLMALLMPLPRPSLKRRLRLKPPVRDWRRWRQSSGQKPCLFALAASETWQNSSGAA